MITINVIQDRFKDKQSVVGNDLGGGRGRDSRTVRRPTRGITLKEDTFATLRVMTAGGDNILLTDAAGRADGTTRDHRKTAVYSNFLLQQVNEERMEKQQILETFGQPYIFLFGERARIMTFAGVLINTFDFNWEAEWWDNYEKFLRGTKCIENDARVFLAFDETLVSGYIIASSSSKNTQDRNHVSFQFTMFLTSYTNFSDIGDGTAVSAAARERAAKVQASTGSLPGDFNIQGPQPLLPGQFIANSILNGSFRPPSLVDGLTSSVSAVANAFANAQQVTNVAFSQFASGDPLRVPVGFAGDLAYDESDVVRVASLADFFSTQSIYGVVKYTEFRDNYDEFVGSSSHYGSSEITIPTTDLLTTLTRDGLLVAQASAQWTAGGFLLPDDQASNVSNFIVKNGLGLTSAGATASWQTAATSGASLLSTISDPSSAARPVSPLPILG